MSDQTRQFVSTSLNNDRINTDTFIGLFLHYLHLARLDFRTGKYRWAWQDLVMAVSWIRDDINGGSVIQ